MRIRFLAGVACVMLGVVLTGAAAEKVQEATTAEGKHVLLYPDGTWRVKPEPEAGSQPPGYAKPPSATSVFRSEKKFVEVWYDADKWKSPSGMNNPAAEFTARHATGDAYAMCIIERIEMDVSHLRDMALENANKVGTATVVQEEERTVNGQKVLSVLADVTLKGISFKFQYYFYSGPDGVVQLIVYTPRNLYEEYKQDLNDFANGLTIVPRS